jgi:hypothetical protein
VARKKNGLKWRRRRRRHACMFSVRVASVQGFGVCVHVSRLKRERRAGESGEGRKRALGGEVVAL